MRWEDTGQTNVLKMGKKGKYEESLFSEAEIHEQKPPHKPGSGRKNQTIIDGLLGAQYGQVRNETP